MPAEMTATGEIIDGEPHIHAVMAIQGDRAVAGPAGMLAAFRGSCSR